MSTVEITDIVKSFGNVQALDDVSISVEKGELFGLLGPNGAGKTTLIRIMLDIFKPDRGLVTVMGGSITEEKKNRIGYMPEERGLYQDIPLERCLVYLASLKGLSPAEARRRVGEYLERFDLGTHRKNKVKELSKGMQQKAQLIATLVHEPELLVVDEPFSGLDPVNTQMVKDLLREQRQRGATILMCTHQMNQVEELCDRLALISQGKLVLYGEPDEIRRQYAEQAVLVRAAEGIALPALAGVQLSEPHNHSMRLVLQPGTTPQQVLTELVRRDIPLESFEIALPTLDEIFIKVVQEGNMSFTQMRQSNEEKHE